jgi:hypothetical protein
MVRALQPTHAPQLAHALGTGRVLQRAHGRRLAHAVGPVRAPQGTPPRAAVRPAAATMWQDRARHVPPPARAAVLPGQPGTASEEITPLEKREGLGAALLPVQVRGAPAGEGPEPGMERARVDGLDLQLQAPQGPVAEASARRRGRLEAPSDSALKGRARPAASEETPLGRRAPRRPGAPPATALADGPHRKTDRRRGRATGRRRAGLVQRQVRSARPHGPTATGPTAQAGGPGAARHIGARVAPLAQEDRTQGAIGRTTPTGPPETGLAGAAP